MVLSIVPKAQGEGQEGGSQQEKVTREKIQVLVKYKGETCDLHHHLSPVSFDQINARPLKRFAKAQGTDPSREAGKP